MTPLRNKGFVTRTNNGYIGEINIDDVVFDINCTFWSYEKPNFIWLQRNKEKIFNEKINTFTDYTPYPFFECRANKQNKKDTFDYCGNFMFVGFKYKLTAWFEDRTEHQLNLSIERYEDQPFLKKMGELGEKNKNI